MASRFSLQKPYIIASLPQPIDRSNGRYVVGEVISGGAGAKKRKRSELAVGIDGEGLSLYDISLSKLITSYALPPQSSFTCPPISVRTRISKNAVERRTYVSTTTPQAQLTLFQAVATGSSIESSTTNHTLSSSSSPVVYLGTISASRAPEAATNTLDILAIREDGELNCFDGESLREKWTSPASALFRDAQRPIVVTKVEFAQLTNAYTASQGILKGRQDIFTLYPQEISEEGFNPDILVIITKSTDQGIRTLHIVSLPRRAAVHMNGLQHSVDSLLTADIPSSATTNNVGGQASFSLQVATGVLQQLENEIVTTFNLSDTLPKEQSSLKTVGGQSFLRLSSTSVLVSSSQSVAVYNPKYQSILATVPLDLPGSSDRRKRKREDMNANDQVSKAHCKFISYFPKLAVAIAILGNKLMGIQVEGHQDRQGRLRTAGLLIDSIGCSGEGQTRPAKIIGDGSTKIDGLKTLDNFLPSTIGHDIPWADQIRDIESRFQEGECDGAFFDRAIAPHLRMNVPEESETSLPNGSNHSEGAKSKQTSSTNGSSHDHLAPSDVDRRWILYALSKMLTVSENEAGESRLSVSFYPQNAFMWLIENGFMTVTNIESALRRGGFVLNSIPPGQLVDMIVDMDRDLNLLLVLVAKNYLGAAELLCVVRYLMESLGLLGENPNTKQGLLANGEDLELPDEDLEKQVEQLEAEIEQDLELAEYRLGPGSGTRGHALSIALSKLYTRPGPDIVYALQTTFSSQETVCLIYLLRFELARGAWTTKYTQTAEIDVADEDAGQQENAIVLISSLLNSCVDAIGAGGWLTGEARLVDGDPFEAKELISSLKLEVSAALEGIEEAVYLKGLTSEMMKYGDAAESVLPTTTNNKLPIILASAGENSSLLPVGLKVEKQIADHKVGAGGAVYKRTKRDIGYLKSQKVGKYSRERIRV